MDLKRKRENLRIEMDPVAVKEVISQGVVVVVVVKEERVRKVIKEARKEEEVGVKGQRREVGREKREVEVEDQTKVGDRVRGPVERRSDIIREVIQRVDTL